MFTNTCNLHKLVNTPSAQAYEAAASADVHVAAACAAADVNVCCAALQLTNLTWMLSRQTEPHLRAVLANTPHCLLTGALPPDRPWPYSMFGAGSTDGSAVHTSGTHKYTSTFSKRAYSSEPSLTEAQLEAAAQHS